ncbi:MAG: ATP-grasp domain-containing protein [Pseudomonadota bacterium]
MAKHVFVIGLDDFHREQIESIRHAEYYVFHGLLPYEMVVHPDSYPIDEMIELGMDEIRDSGVRPDAVIGHWDFPTPALRVVFRDALGLPGPSLESILIAEHKYWSRLRQGLAIPENIPGFQSLDPFDPDAASRLELTYPFWIKPNIGFSSQMVYYVENRDDLDAALAGLRAGLPLFGSPFDRFVARATLPSDIPIDVDAFHCTLEKPIGGWQCTLEGYVRHGETVVYGVVDSVREGGIGSSFARYEFPSQLPESIQERMIEITRRAVPAMELDDTPFNIEYFWDQEHDRIWLLEVNTRISQSHSPLFMDVAGASHHEVAIDLALGRKPSFPRREGPHQVAIKFMLRHFEDAVVTRVPTDGEIRSLEHEFPGTRIQIEVEEGMRLSEMPGQEVYSYEVAAIFMGGPSHEHLMARYDELLERLPLEFHDIGARAPKEAP